MTEQRQPLSDHGSHFTLLDLWIRKWPAYVLTQTLLDLDSLLHKARSESSFSQANNQPWRRERAIKRLLEDSCVLMARLDLHGIYELERNKNALSAAEHKVCAHCGSADNVHVDHMIPRSRGGSHHITNLQLLCRACNSSKGARTMEEWLASDAPRAKLRP